MAASGPSMQARVQVVAEAEDRAAAIAGRLAERIAATVQVCAPGDVAATDAEVLVVAFETVAAGKRHALAVRVAAAKSRKAPVPAGTPVLPVIVMSCSASEVEAASRAVREGLFDDYVPDAAFDPHRLETAVLQARRLAAFIGRERERPLVLVVEDDEVARELVSASLGVNDSVELAFEADGANAFDRIRELKPDLVLMDIMLPGGDGVELTGQMKREAGLSAIPVVMLTGEARRETFVRCMEAGASDFIVKPFTPDALRSKLAKYLPVLV